MVEVEIKLSRKNFDVEIRENFTNGITGIFGPSGSGKTTLLHAISGLAKPDKGKITIGDNVVFSAENKINVPVEKRNIGYVFQEGRLFPHMTVAKNLMYGIKKNAPNKIQFEEVVELLNLGYILKSKPAQISGGERQRTALGRSLLSSPDILLLDEPFSAVDTRLRQQILPFIIRIQQKVKVPILIVSHDLPDLLKLSNKICVIKNGKCLGHDDFFQLLKQEEIKQIMGAGEIINSVSLEVETVDFKNGLTILWDGFGPNRVKVKSDVDKTGYIIGQRLNFFVNADDIALSVEKPSGLTIQNQLKGKVKDIVDLGSSVLCKIDVGFDITAEITTSSLNKLQLQIGSNVWCLFKSVAVEVVG